MEDPLEVDTETPEMRHPWRPTFRKVCAGSRTQLRVSCGMADWAGVYMNRRRRTTVARTEFDESNRKSRTHGLGSWVTGAYPESMRSSYTRTWRLGSARGSGTAPWVLLIALCTATACSSDPTSPSHPSGAPATVGIGCGRGHPDTSSGTWSIRFDPADTPRAVPLSATEGSLLLVLRGRSEVSGAPGDVMLVDPQTGKTCSRIQATTPDVAPLAASVTHEGLVAWVGHAPDGRAAIGLASPVGVRERRTAEHILTSTAAPGGSSCLPCEVASGDITVFRHGPTVAIVDGMNLDRAVNLDVPVPQPTPRGASATVAVAGRIAAVATAVAAPSGTRPAVTFRDTTGQVLDGSGPLMSMDGRPDPGGVLEVASTGAGFLVTTTTTTTWFRQTAAGVTAAARYPSSVAVPFREQVVTLAPAAAPEALEVHPSPEEPARLLSVGTLGGRPRPLLVTDPDSDLLWTLRTIPGTSPALLAWPATGAASRPVITAQLDNVGPIDRVVLTPSAFLITGSGALSSFPRTERH